VRPVDVNGAIADGELAVLRLKVIAPQVGRLDLTHLHRCRQPTDRRAVLDQHLVVKIPDPKELPPFWAFLPSVPADQSRQQRLPGLSQPPRQSRLSQFGR